MLSKIKQIFQKNKNATPYKKELSTLESSFYALVVTDGHGTLPRYLDNFMKDTGDIDVVFYLGDLELPDFRELNAYEKIASATKLGVVGNHDGFDDLQEQGIEDIHGKVVSFHGIDILGIRGSFKYKDTVGPMMTDEESIHFVENLPECDLLITHDWSKHEEMGNTAHKGMAGISKYIKEKSPVAHIHGHIHDCLERMVEDTKSYCFFKLAYIKVTREGIEILKAYGK